MADDTLIRVGDGATQEWVLSTSNTGLTGVTVNGLNVSYTQPAWNKVKLAVVPAYGAIVKFAYTGTDGAEVDTAILDAINGLAAQVAASAASSAASSAGSGAVSGEVKLFALQGGQAAPAGWELDASREVVAADLPTVGVMPTFNSSYVSSGAAYSQVGEYVYSTFNGTQIFRSRPMVGGVDATLTSPQTYVGSGYPALCPLGGKVAIIGGINSSSRLTAVYELGVDGVFTTLNALPYGVANASAIELPGNRILVVGGSTGSGVYSNALLLFTKGTGWQVLTATLDETVAYPHLAKLPSGKVGIFSGAVNGTGTRSVKYYIFDTNTLTHSGAKTIPGAHLPSSPYSGMTLRTSNGAAFITQNVNLDTNHFSEYNEATDSFAAFQMKLPATWLVSEGSLSGTVNGQDLQPSAAGHVLFSSSTAIRSFVALKSGLIPSYRYMRKQ